MSDSQAKAKALLQEFKGEDYAHGLGVMDRVGPLSAVLGKRALFIGSLESKWFAPCREKVLGFLKTAGVEVVGEAKGAGPNAPFVDVYRMHSHIVHKKPEVIVAMGGGSTIDAAKAAAALASLGDIAPEIDPFFGVGQVSALTREHQRTIMPVMAVMTAASSAAHLTKYSNITDPVAGQKKLIVDEAIVPPKAVFDYEITVRQPKSLTLDGALDGVSHCVEVYLGATPEVEAKTGEICQTALDLIIAGVLQASQDPQDLDARMNLGLGTDLGGYAIMVGGTSGPHLNSFSLVDVLSHGRACAVMNPYYTVFFAPAVEEKLRAVGAVYKKHGLITKDLAALSGRDLGVAVAEGMLTLSRKIGFPTRLQDVPGISRAHVERCLTAAKNPVLDMKLRNMPVPLNARLVDEYMGSILEAAWREDFSLIKTMP
jgi:alcohol dehydrogenase